MFLKNIQKTISAQNTVVQAAGLLLVYVVYAGLKLLSPEMSRHLSWSFLIIAPAVWFIQAFYTNFQLIRGKWNIDKWSGSGFFRVAALGWIVWSWIAVSIPEYSLFSTAMCFIGSLVVVGLHSNQKVYITGSIVYPLLFCGFYYFRFGYPDQASMLMIIVNCILGSSMVLFIGSTSAFWQQRNVQTSKLLRNSRKDKRTIAHERARSDALLLNILPEPVAEELKSSQKVTPVRFDSASVLFTDFKGFTRIAEAMSADELIGELDRCFSYFDDVIERNNLEKLKTIGDSFMCAGGIPVANQSHAVDCVLAALEIQSFMNQMKEIKKQQGLDYWELRLGIHTGPLIAGVIGNKKFAYDIWGDTVNTASRAESSGEEGRINITGETYRLIGKWFICEFRGQVAPKNKGLIDMYFVNRIKPEFSLDNDGRVFNPDVLKKLREE